MLQAEGHVGGKSGHVRSAILGIEGEEPVPRHLLRVPSLPRTSAPRDKLGNFKTIQHSQIVPHTLGTGSLQTVHHEISPAAKPGKPHDLMLS
ncbi:rCG35836 [Rattus norvegicus]|uniref:RCG35836 n=1 Tax=Rattus norvegicus TaxID=10116 RepID=A6IJW9_RAT|nr:rCG35836 [Rattus norvegicus]